MAVLTTGTQGEATGERRTGVYTQTQGDIRVLESLTDFEAFLVFPTSVRSGKCKTGMC